MSEDTDQASFDFWVDIFFDVTQQNVNRKKFFNLFGANIIPIKGKISKELKLCSNDIAFPRMIGDKLL